MPVGLQARRFCFGDYDIVAIFELPDNVSAAAFAFAATANPTVKALKTTPLLTMTQGIAAMRQAPGLRYRPPS